MTNIGGHDNAAQMIRCAIVVRSRELAEQVFALPERCHNLDPLVIVARRAGHFQSALAKGDAGAPDFLRIDIPKPLSIQRGGASTALSISTPIDGWR